MKYLLLTLFVVFCGTLLSAQDTLYVKGERKPLIVNITIVKKKSLNYTNIGSGLIRTVKLKNVRKIKFYKESESKNSVVVENPERTEVKVYPKFDEFMSTFSLNSVGSHRYYAGLNYLYHLKGIKSKSQKHNFFINVGGGYYNRRPTFLLIGADFLSRATGYYLEFGFRTEISSQKNPKNRFHLGLDINNRWVEETRTDFFNPVDEVLNLSQLSVQVPIGYTFRSPAGFYLTTGLELTTEKIFPAAYIGLGVAFGK